MITAKLKTWLPSPCGDVQKFLVKGRTMRKRFMSNKNLTIVTMRKHLMKFELELLEEYAKKLETLIKKEAAKLEQQKQDEFFENYTDDFWMLQKVFPNIFRSSLFIACYTLLENQLIDICELLQGQYNYTIKVSDLKGRGITVAKIYLKKVACIDFPDQSSHWKKILKYNLIRNVVVHNRCRLDEDNKNAKEIRTFIKNSSSLSLDDNEYIQFSKKFILEVLDSLNAFSNDFFKAWASWAKILDTKSLLKTEKLLT